MSVSNFNFVAPFYDSLVRLVFGKTLWKAQQIHLNTIQRRESVLILGGGTGRILNWLPAGCDVTYLELSEAMILRAKKKGRANFVHADFLAHPLDQKFDWVICPFFLDCFDEEVLEIVLDKIYRLMNENGRLIVTDFHVSNTHQKSLANLMIWFFRLTANLPAIRLLPIQEIISKTGFIRKDSHFLRGDFIFSDIYRKKETF